MKQLIYMCIVTLVAFCACSDDQEYAQVDIPENAFTFKPVMGGAVMHYTLPQRPDVVGIRVRYQDAYGTEMLRSGSNLCDSLELPGFNEAKENVAARVNYIMQDGMESEPTDVSFNTLDSSPITFINSAQVKPGWGGFSLDFDNGTGAKGMAHVFYLGTNPLTNEPDTVLVNTFTLNDGKDTLNFKLQQNREESTIIVKVEDYRGYMVRERIWENVEILQSERLSPGHFEILYGNSVEDDTRKLSLKYLTDGDTKGAIWFSDADPNHFFTFLSGNFAVGDESEPMYIDLKELRKAAEVRFYAYLNVGKSYSASPDFYYGWNRQNQYYNLLPCSVTVYGCRENSDDRDWGTKEWVQIGKFEDSPDAEEKSRWTWNSAMSNNFGSYLQTVQQVNDSDPIYMAVDFVADGQGEGYRYLKIQFNQVYNLPFEYTNGDNRRLRRLTLHELEVYSEKTK